MRTASDPSAYVTTATAAAPAPAVCRDRCNNRAMTLPHRTLANSGISVSIMSLGSWRTFERIDRDAGLAVMSAARDAGIDFLDDARYDDETGTAPIPTGWSEVVFGELFRAAGWRRDDVTVANKLWWEHWPEQDAAAELDGSLARMGFDHVDVIYALPAPTAPSVAVVVEQVAGLIVVRTGAGMGDGDVAGTPHRRGTRRVRRHRCSSPGRRPDGVQPGGPPPVVRSRDPRRARPRRHRARRRTRACRRHAQRSGRERRPPGALQAIVHRSASASTTSPGRSANLPARGVSLPPTSPRVRARSSQPGQRPARREPAGADPRERGRAGHVRLTRLGSTRRRRGTRLTRRRDC